MGGKEGIIVVIDQPPAVDILRESCRLQISSNKEHTDKSQCRNGKRFKSPYLLWVPRTSVRPSIGHIEYLRHFSIKSHQIFYRHLSQHSEHNCKLFFLREKYGTGRSTLAE